MDLKELSGKVEGFLSETDKAFAELETGTVADVTDYVKLVQQIDTFMHDPIEGGVSNVTNTELNNYGERQKELERQRNSLASILDIASFILPNSNDIN